MENETAVQVLTKSPEVAERVANGHMISRTINVAAIPEHLAPSSTSPPQVKKDKEDGRTRRRTD